MTELSDVFLIVTFPLPALTNSSKFKIMSVVLATPVSLSAGTDEVRVGSVLSTVPKNSY